MSQPYFESSNVNDILRVAQKSTYLNVLRMPPGYPATLKDCAIVPFYQNDASNPTLFRQELDQTIPGGINATWPASGTCEQFGITAVQGQPVFSAEDQAIYVVGNLDYTGWTENYGIGV